MWPLPKMYFCNIIRNVIVSRVSVLMVTALLATTSKTNLMPSEIFPQDYPVRKVHNGFQTYQRWDVISLFISNCLSTHENSRTTLHDATRRHTALHDGDSTAAGHFEIIERVITAFLRHNLSTSTQTGAWWFMVAPVNTSRQENVMHVAIRCVLFWQHSTQFTQLIQ